MSPTLRSRPIRATRTAVVVAVIVVVVVAGLALLVVWGPWNGPRSASSAPAVLVAKYRSAEDGQVSFGGGLGRAGQVEFGLNARRCLTFGKGLVIAQPGSHLSADGRTVTIVCVDGGTHTFGIGSPVRLGLGGTPAFTRYPRTVPELADGLTAAACGATPSTALLVLQGADSPTVQ